MKKFIEIVKKKWIRDTSKTIIMIVVLFVVFIGINLIIQKLDLQDIDVTANKLYTLSESSKDQIKNINKTVTINAIGLGEDTSIIDLIKQYTKQNENIILEMINNVNDRPDLKEMYNLTDETQIIIIATEDNNKIISPEDFYTYDYITSQQIDITEEKITNAIMDLTKEERPKIYFLTGHNEYSINNELIELNAYLVNELNNVESLDLLVTEKIPEDINLLVIASPEKDFMDKEVEIITSYINEGGKILWMNDPTFTDTAFPNIQKILDLFGVKFEQGIVLEQDATKMALQSPNYIIPNISYTNATKNIATDGGILLINATKISLADDEKLEELDVTPSVVLSTSDTALFRTDVSSSSSSKIPSDEEGSFILGVKLTKILEKVLGPTINAKHATLYAISNNFFISDYQITVGNQKTIPIAFYNNKDYIINTIAELTENEDAISIRKDIGAVTYIATQGQNNMIKIAIIAFPAIILIVGIVVWSIRRRKK